MSVKIIIDELIRRNIKLKIDGEELNIVGAKENITPEIICRIKENKKNIIEYIKSPASNEMNRPKGQSGLVPAHNGLRKPLDFSLFYFGNATIEDVSEKYKLLIEGAKHADENGYTAVWTPERHFNQFGGLYPSPSVLGAALAAITKNIQIRAGSVVLPLHEPLRVAEEWSVVDNLSGGRVGIACASGWQANDFVLSPEIFRNRHAIMYEKINVIRRLWKGEAIELKDGNGKIKDTRIFPRPIQKELPVWITSVGNIETFKSAGRLGFNVLTHLVGESAEELSVRIKAYRDAYKESGHDISNAKVTLMLHTYIDEDIEKTYAKARAPFINYLKTSLGLIRNHAISLGHDIDSAIFSSQDLEDTLSYSFYRYAETASLIGTKTSALKMLDKLSNIGVNEIAALIDFGVEYQPTMRSLQYLTELKSEYNRNIDHSADNSK